MGNLPCEKFLQENSMELILSIIITDEEDINSSPKQIKKLLKVLYFGFEVHFFPNVAVLINVIRDCLLTEFYLF